MGGLERARVRRHLRRAEAHARTAPQTGLTHVQRTVRSLLLRELERYRRAGRFPVNRDFDSATPYFIDARGTRCAMAHLLELGGESELVRKIAAERNNARVRELADEPRLIAWLEAAGLSVAEAALIQPSYCSTLRNGCVCSSSGVMFEAVAVDTNADHSVTARIEVVHGPSDLAAGDEIEVSAGRIQPGVPLLVSAHTAADGSVDYYGREFATPQSCTGEAPFLTRSQWASAASASDCEGYLQTLDPRWEQSVCDEEACSCSVPGAPLAPPTSLGILVALLAATGARRALKRRPRTTARKG